MRKILPFILGGIAAISFSAFAQTTAPSGDVKSSTGAGAEVDKSSQKAPHASGSTTVDAKSDAARGNASAGSSATADTKADKPKKQRKAKRNKDNASSGASAGAAGAGGAGSATANQGGQAGTQAPATSAAGSPGTRGTMGNPGAGANPHAGSGAGASK